MRNVHLEDQKVCEKIASWEVDRKAQDRVLGGCDTIIWIRIVSRDEDSRVRAV